MIKSKYKTLNAVDSDIDIKINENNNINWISKICFLWMNDILNLANKTDLKQEDITKKDSMSLPLECTCLFNGSLLQTQWKDNNKSLFSSIIYIYSREFLMIGFLLLATSLLAFIGPVFLKLLTSCATDPLKNYYNITLYIFLLFFAKLIGAVMSAHFNFRVNNISISIRSGIKYCLFQKLMTISASSKRSAVGNMTNIYTVDVDRIVTSVISLHNLWIMPLQIILACYLLFDVVSYAMFVGLGSIAIILIINNYISILQKQKVDLMMKYKDQRMKTTSEVFVSMLTIKLHNLESKFYSLIISSRTEELIHVWGLLLVSAFNIFLLWMVIYL
jgi:ABC-type bacteriocin/lantibiotic exporter with double-glycine peptidase domain